MIKSISTYALVDVFTKVISLLILPLVANSLSVEDFGLYRFSIDISMFVVTVSTLGLAGMCARFNFSEDVDNNKIFGGSFTLSTLVSIGGGLFIVPFMMIYGYTLLEALIVFCSSVVSMALVYPRVYFITNELQTNFALYLIVQSVFFFAGIALLESFGWISLPSVLFTYLVAQLVSMSVALGFFVEIKYLSIKYSIYCIKNVDISEYSKKIYGTSVVSYLVQNFDRFLVAGMLSKSELGVYGMMIMLCAAVRGGASAVIMTVQPLYFKCLKDGNASQESLLALNIRRILIVCPVLLCLFVCFVYLYSFFIRAEYTDSIVVLASVYALFIICDSFYQLSTYPLLYLKKVSLLFKLEASAAAIQISFGVICAYFFGVLGVIFGGVIIQFFRLLTLIYVNRRDLIYCRLRKPILLSFLCCSLVCWVVNYLA